MANCTFVLNGTVFASFTYDGVRCAAFSGVPEATKRERATGERRKRHTASPGATGVAPTTLLRVSRPNQDDRKRAARRRVSPGGGILIHGVPCGLGWIGRSHRWVDWTAGSIAVTNPEIEEIWQAVPDGTPIEIKPWTRS